MGETRGMRRAVFLQVRLSSSRLPGKAMLPLADRPVIGHAMESLSRIPVDVHAILTDASSAQGLAKIAKSSGFEVFPGEPDDVLKRYADACRKWKIDRYFRATGDNPLVSAPLALDLEEFHNAAGAHFSGFLGLPLGTGVECVEASALFCAESESTDPYEREHASPFIYRQPNRFRIVRPWAADEFLQPDARVTLDTADDYERLKIIYSELYDGNPIETHRLVEWIRTREERSKDAFHTLFPLDTAG